MKSKHGTKVVGLKHKANCALKPQAGQDTLAACMDSNERLTTSIAVSCTDIRTAKRYTLKFVSSFSMMTQMTDHIYETLT